MLQSPRYLQLDDGRIEYFWHGPPPEVAPTLVFLHEGLGCAELWRDVPDELAERTGLGALTYSRFGYGGSDPWPLPWPITFMHREANTVLPQVLADLDVKETIFVGHSDGASIALIYAGSVHECPIRAMILEAPHIFWEADGNASIARTREQFETADLRERLARYHGDNVDNAFNGWAGAWLAPEFRDWNLEGHLPSISAPILLIQGRDDEYGTMAHVEMVAARIAGEAEIVVLDDCGHTPHRDQRQQALDAMAKFIAKVMG